MNDQQPSVPTKKSPLLTGWMIVAIAALAVSFGPRL